MAKKSKVTASSYIKNAGRSLGYATIETLKEYNPVITGFIETNGNIASIAYKEIKKLAKTTKHSSASASRVRGLMNTGKGLALEYRDNLLDDIRTGKFYNKEREDRIGESAAQSMADGMAADFGDDFDFDFDDSDSGSFDFDSTPEMSMMDRVGEKTSNAIANVLAEATEYQVQAQKESTDILYKQQNAIYVGLHQGMGTINQNLAHILEFFNGAATTHFQNSQTYYERTENLMKEQNDTLKEILEIQKKMYGQKENKGYSSSDKIRFSDINGFDGAFDIEKYFKYIMSKSGSGALSEIKNLKSTIDQYGGLEQMIRLMTASPAKFIAQGASKKLIGKQAKKSMENLNESLSGLFGNLMAFVDRKKGGFGIGSKIAEFLGIDTGIRSSVSTSDYEKGPIPFDGMTKKAIIDVIPLYLSKIYSAVSGAELTVFDYNSGKYVKAKNIKNQIKSIKSSSANYMMSDLNDIISSYASSMNLGSRDRERLMQEQELVFSYMLKNGFDKFNDKRRKGRTNLTPSSYGGQNDIESIRMAQLIQQAYNSLSNTQISSLNSKRYRTFDDINDQYANIGTDSGNPLINAFNDGLEDTNERLQESIESNRRVFTSMSQFGQATLEYLYNINKELSFMREYGLGVSLGQDNGRASRRRSRDFNSYTLGHSQINIESTQSQYTREINQFSQTEWDQSVQNAIERYNESRNRDFDYDFGTRSIFKELGDDIMDSFKVDGEDVGLIKIFKSMQKISTKPSTFMASIIDKVDQRIYDMLFNTEDNGDNSILKSILSNIKTSFGKFNQWIQDTFIQPLQEKLTKENMKKAADKILGIFGISTDSIREYFFDKETGVFGKGFFNGIKDTFKNVFSWIGKQPGRIFNAFTGRDDGTGATEEIPQAAEGLRRVSKTGVIVASKGEMVVPPDLNPFNISKRYSAENKQKKKFLSKYGFKSDIANFAGQDDEKPDFESLSVEDIKNLVKQKGISYFNSMDGYKALRRAGYSKKYIKASMKTREAMSSMKDEAKYGLDYLFDFFTEGKNKFSESGKSISDELSSFTKSAMQEMKDKFPQMAVGGAIGAGISTITGMIGGPLLGAAVGAGTSLLINSETLQDKLFGALDDAGFGRITNAIKKYLPSMGGGAALGGLAALVPGVPLPPVVGIILGSAVGFASKNESIKNFLFGERNGILKDLKMDEAKVKKLLARAGLGAIAGAVIGPLATPLGLVPSIMLGGATGLLSTNDKFKEYLFGDDGLLTYYRDKIKGAIDPIGAEIRKKLNDVNNFFKKQLGNLLDKYVAKPLGDFIKKSIVGKIGSKIAQGAKAILKTPATLIGAIGDNLKAKQISKGYATYMTAQERLDWRDEQAQKNKGLGSLRYNKYLKGKKDKYLQLDQDMAGMSDEDIARFSTQVDLFRNASKNSHKSLREANDLMGELNVSGKYDYNTLNQLTKLYKGKSTKELDDILNTNALTSAQREELKSKFISIKTKRDDALAAIDDIDGAKSKAAELFKKKFNINLDDKNADKISELLKSESDARKDSNRRREQTPGTPEWAENQAKDRHKDIMDKMSEIVKVLYMTDDEKRGNTKGKNKGKKKRKTIFDQKGNPLNYIENPDGTSVMEKNDTDTDNTLKIQAHDDQVQEDIANATTSMSSKVENIFSRMLGNDDDDEKESFIDKLISKLPLIGTGIGAAIAATGTTGIFDSIVDKISQILPWGKGNDITGHGIFSFNEKQFAIDENGVKKELLLDDNGNYITDEQGNIMTADGSYVNADSYIYNESSGKSFGARLRESALRSIVRPKSFLVKHPFNLKNASRLIGSIPEKRANIIAKLGKFYQKHPISGKLVNKAINSLDDVERALMSRGDDLLKAFQKIPAVRNLSAADGPIANFINKVIKYISKNIGKLSAKEISEGIQTASGVLQLVMVIYDFDGGYREARSTFGIVSEPTAWQRVISGVIRAVKNLLPFVGVLIPDKCVINFALESLAPMFGIDTTDIDELRRQAKEEVNEYNMTHGTDYSIEDYNRYVQGDGTILGKLWDKAKSKYNNTKENGIKGFFGDWKDGFDASKDIIKSNMFGEDAKGIPLLDRISNTFSGIGDILNSGQYFGMVGTFVSEAGITGNWIKSLASALKGDVKGVWTSQFDMVKKSPILGITSFAANLPISIICTISALLVKMKKKMLNFASNVVTGLFSSLFGEFGEHVSEHVQKLTGTNPDKDSKSYKKASLLGSVAKKGINFLKHPVKNFNAFLDKKIYGSSAKGSGIDDGTFVSQTSSKYSGINFTIPGDTSKQTIKDNGCGPAVATMAINALKKNKSDKINMNTASKEALKYKMNDGGVDAAYFQDIFKKNGVGSQYISGANKNANISNALKNGSNVILMGQDQMNNSKSKSPFGPSNHYVLATGMSKNGKYIYVNDPEGKTPNKRYLSSKILNSSKLGIATFVGEGSNLSKRVFARYYGSGPSDDYIGKYTKQFESGSSGSATIAHCGNDGGGSFGSYQMCYGGGSTAARDFWRTYYADKYGEETSLGDLKEKWMKAVNDDPDGFFTNEHDYIKKCYYEPAKAKLQGFFDPDTYSRAMQDCIWSWAVHRGVGGCNKEFRLAMQNAGISNPQTCDETKLINACYDQRAKSAPSCSNRYNSTNPSNERAVILGLVGQNPIKDDGTISNKSTAKNSSPTTSSSKSTGIIGELTNAFSSLASAYGLTDFSNDISGESGDQNNSSDSDSSSDTNKNATRAKSSGLGNRIVEFAKKIQPDIKYIYGADNYPNFDCSSYARYVYRNVTEQNIGRTTDDQLDNNSVLTNIDYSQAEPGDLLLWHMNGSTKALNRPSHVGIYLGDNKVLHNSEEGVNVIESNLNSNGSMGSNSPLVGVKRYVGATASGSNISKSNRYINPDRSKLVSQGKAHYSRYGAAASGSGIPTVSSWNVFAKGSNIPNNSNNISNTNTSGSSNSTIIKLVQVVVQILKKISTNTDNLNNIVSILTELVDKSNMESKQTSKNAIDVSKLKAALVDTMNSSVSTNDDRELMDLIKSVETLAME